MRPWKYIVFDIPVGPTIVIFPPTIEHLAMSHALKGPILGAGFVDFYNEPNRELACYGKSVGLGIESRGKADTKLATKLLGGEL